MKYSSARLCHGTLKECWCSHKCQQRQRLKVIDLAKLLCRLSIQLHISIEKWYDIERAGKRKNITLKSAGSTLKIVNVHNSTWLTRYLPYWVKGLLYVEVLMGVNHISMSRPHCWSFSIVKQLDQMYSSQLWTVYCKLHVLMKMVSCKVMMIRN